MAQRPITDPLVLLACEMLSGLGPCKAVRMFGGYGLSVDGMNLGLIAWDTLYLKTNADTESQWLAAGAKPFIYEAKGKPMKLNYHTPPADALESPALMQPWARLALQAAVAARKQPPAHAVAKKVARVLAKPKGKALKAKAPEAQAPKVKAPQR